MLIYLLLMLRRLLTFLRDLWSLFGRWPSWSLRCLCPLGRSLGTSCKRGSPRGPSLFRTSSIWKSSLIMLRGWNDNTIEDAVFNPVLSSAIHFQTPYNPVYPFPPSFPRVLVEIIKEITQKSESTDVYVRISEETDITNWPTNGSGSEPQCSEPRHIHQPGSLPSFRGA